MTSSSLSVEGVIKLCLQKGLNHVEYTVYTYRQGEKLCIKIFIVAFFFVNIFIEGKQKSTQVSRFPCTVELQWFKHLWDHENMFETRVVRANVCSL